MWKTCAMDIIELQVDDCWYDEGTICLVNEWIGVMGIVFEHAWAHEQVPLKSQWLVAT